MKTPKLTEQDVRNVLVSNKEVRDTLKARIMHYAPFKKYKKRKPRLTAGQFLRNIVVGTAALSPKSSHIDWERLALEAAIDVKTSQFVDRIFNRRG